jgi:hypothetical protein
MKFIVRQPKQVAGGQLEMQTIPLEDILVQQFSVLAIDGSTTNTGMSILRESDGALLYSISAAREKDKETPVRYKIQLKRQVCEILKRNKYIQTIIYEEPVVAYASAVGNLFMLKAFIEEMVIENEPDFNYLKTYEVSNMKWKKLFLAPDKIPQGSEKQKEAVRKRLESSLPFLSVVTQDEIDSISMGYVACVNIMKNVGLDELQSKKKPSKFLYNIQFVGAEDDETVFQEFGDTYEGPQSILENGIRIQEIDGRAKFDKTIYELMGSDDKLLIIKFSSKHHGNVVLEHKIGGLAATFPYIYAFVWRKTRKF